MAKTRAEKIREMKLEVERRKQLAREAQAKAERLSKPFGGVKEFFKPTEEVRARDVAREIPRTIKEFAQESARGTAGVGLGLLSDTIQPGLKEQTIRPKTRFSKAIFGDEEIPLLEKRMERSPAKIREYAKQIGIDMSEKQAGFYGPIAVAGLTTLDVTDLLFPGSKAGAKVAFKRIAKSKQVPEIVKALKNFRIGKDESINLAKKLVDIDDEKQIIQIVKTQEIASDIKTATGVNATSKMKEKIAKNVRLAARMDEAKGQKYLEDMTEQIIDSSPAKNMEARVGKVFKQISKSDNEKLRQSLIKQADEGKITEQTFKELDSEFGRVYADEVFEYLSTGEKIKAKPITVMEQGDMVDFIEHAVGDKPLQGKNAFDVELRAREILEKHNIPERKTIKAQANEFAKQLDKQGYEPYKPGEDFRPLAEGFREQLGTIATRDKKTGRFTGRRSVDQAEVKIVEEAKKFKTADEFVKAQTPRGYKQFSEAEEQAKKIFEKYKDSNIDVYGSFSTLKRRGSGAKKPDLDIIIEDSKISDDIIKFNKQEIADRREYAKKFNDNLDGNEISRAFKNDSDAVSKLTTPPNYDDLSHRVIDSKIKLKFPDDVETWFKFSGDGTLRKIEGGLQKDQLKFGRKSLDEAIQNFDIKTRSQLTDIWNKAHGKESFGAVAGIEVDEDGKVSFDPEKAILGVGAIKFGSKVDIKKLPKLYQDLAKTKKTSPIIKKGGDIAKSMKEVVGKALTPISTRLENIHPSFKNAIRKFEFNVGTKTAEDSKRVVPFLRKANKLDKESLKILDLAVKNGDSKVINQIAEAGDLTEELAEVRKTLDGLHERAIDAGVDLGYKENYFPRSIKDVDGFMNHLKKTEDWGMIQDALRVRAEKLGIKVEDLELEEQAQIVNNLLRGYGDKISLSKISNFKERNIDVVTKELNEYYDDFQVSLAGYVSNANNLIESRKFFGKGDSGNVKLNDSIATYVIKALKEGKIIPEQEKELTSILKSRFNQGRMNKFVRVYKNLEYIDTMGSPTSAVTQLGDLAFAMYKNGVYQTGKEFAKALFKKSKLSRADIGVEQIAQEFADGSTSGKAVSKVFKLVGLEKMDSLGKETLINSSLNKYTKLAKKNPDKLEKEIKKIFGSETADVMEDLAEGAITDNVKLLLFNDLLDIQPVSLSEMPQKYLESGSGRIFYMLKTYQLKLLDIYRRDVFREMKTNPVKAVKNFVKLTAALTTMNVAADEIKDWMLGRETDFEDRVVDNIFKLAGFGKYEVYKARQEGIGSAVGKKILPPFKFIDNVYKDLVKGTEDGTETASSIPVGGKLYYWWVGKGQVKQEKKAKEPREIFKKLDKMKASEANAELQKLKKTDKDKYRSVVKYLEWDKLGVTKEEEKLASLSVRDGDRAKEIMDYIQGESKKATVYNRLKEAGIITAEVDSQLRKLK